MAASVRLLLRLALLLSPFAAFGQTPSEIVFLKLIETRQTSAGRPVVYAYDFAATVTFATPPPASTTVTASRPDGPTIQFTRQDDGSYEAKLQYDTIGQLDTTFPDDRYTVVVSGGGSRSTTSSSVIFGRAMQPSTITNFDALQAADSPNPTILWSATGGNDDSILVLTITAPDGSDVPTPDLHGYSALANLYNLPNNVPLTADLTYAAPVSGEMTDNGVVFGSGYGWNVEFPMKVVASPPTITGQPEAAAVQDGGNVYLNSGVSSTSAVTYQWYKNGVAIPGATGYLYSIISAHPADAGAYSVKVTNIGGSVTSAPANVAVGGALSITTVATGTQGQSSFAQLAVDASGNVYVADNAMHVIWKLPPAGTLTVFAGQLGVSGSADGVGTQAQFKNPVGVAVDPSGNVWVSDTGNGTIRRIAPSGNVATIAGQVGVAGFTDGPETAARFAAPGSLAIDPAGNVYIADQQNFVIRKLSTDGTVSTLAGAARQQGTADGAGVAARFNLISSLAFDSHGNLLATELTGGGIRRITVSGDVTTRANYNAILVGLTTLSDGSQLLYSSSNLVHWHDGVFEGYTTYFGSDRSSVTGGFSGGVLAIAPNTVLFATSDTIFKAQITPAAGVLPKPVVAQPSVTVAPGDAIALQASGPLDMLGSWFKDDLPIPSDGRTTALIRGATAADAGRYRFGVYTQAGFAFSDPVTVTVSATATPGQLANLSIRSAAGSGPKTLIVGLSIGGSGQKRILLRGVGPSLARFGLSNGLADPLLTLYRGTTAIQSNDNWTPDLAPVFDPVGAFPLQANSADAAMVASLATGTYSAQITGAGSGIAIAEVYDLEAAPSALARLTNISARTQVGTGDNVLITGFAITGDTAKTVLIRAVGTTLANFGLNYSDLLGDPKLQLYHGPSVIAENNNWTYTPRFHDLFDSLGAFQLPPGSLDSVLLLTLPPGVYSVKVSGVNDGTGVALAEVYEVK